MRDSSGTGTGNSSSQPWSILAQHLEVCHKSQYSSEVSGKCYKTDTIHPAHPNLNLTPEEKRIYGNLLKEADPDGFGAVSGDVAVKFFERTRLPPDVLGQVSLMVQLRVAEPTQLYAMDRTGQELTVRQIWQIADTENRGFLTPAGFGVVLRLIGHAQAGRAPSVAIAPSRMSISQITRPLLTTRQPRLYLSSTPFPASLLNNHNRLLQQLSQSLSKTQVHPRVHPPLPVLSESQP